MYKREVDYKSFHTLRVHRPLSVRIPNLSLSLRIIPSPLAPASRDEPPHSGGNESAPPPPSSAPPMSPASPASNAAASPLSILGASSSGILSTYASGSIFAAYGYMSP